MQNIDRAFVINYWTAMLREFDAKIRPKDKSWMMTTAGRVLERRGVMTQEEFAGMATTVGDTVYLPYRLGTEEEGWGLIQQVTNCPHEMVHVAQAEGRKYRFYWRYVTSKSWRVKYEREAYGGSIMAYHVVTGRYADPVAIASKLRSYECSDNDMHNAMLYYVKINNGLRDGKFIGHPAANKCVSKLKEMLK